MRGRLGYAPEHDALPPDVAAHDVVRHLAELHGLPRREATSRASDALWEVGLGEERFRPVGTMSTGQRQRVKLAQAIVHDPELLLLDEPTNGLDPSQREEMLDLIGHVGRDLGMHVILSSHLLEEVQRVSVSVVILDAGRVVVDGEMAELRRSEPEIVVEVDPDGRPDPAADLVSLPARRGHLGEGRRTPPRRCPPRCALRLRRRSRHPGGRRVFGAAARAPHGHPRGRVPGQLDRGTAMSGREDDVVASDDRARIFEPGYRPYEGSVWGSRIPCGPWPVTPPSGCWD